MRRLALVAALAAAGFGLWFALRRDGAAGAHASAATSTTPASDLTERAGRSAGAAPSVAVAPPSPVDGQASSAVAPRRAPEAPVAAERDHAKTGIRESGSVPTPGVPRLPASAAPDDGGALTDKTGWDPQVMKAFNHAFMPLASECIALAQARHPDLEGLLAFQVQIAPGPDDKVLVAALTRRPDNQITDPELFECIEQSSFSLDGVTAPHDFDITMPIAPPRPE